MMLSLNASAGYMQHSRVLFHTARNIGRDSTLDRTGQPSPHALHLWPCRRGQAAKLCWKQMPSCKCHPAVILRRLHAPAGRRLVLALP